MKDETVVSCTVIGSLTAIALGCLYTGYNSGAINTLIAAIASVGGIAIGRATKKE